MSSEEPHEELVEVLEDEYVQNYSTDADTTCTICQAEFLDPDDLAIHLQKIHKVSLSEAKLCQFCMQKYTDLVNYAEHFRNNHLTSLYYCSHCLRAFNDEDDQRFHEKKHKRGLKALLWCTLCNESFNSPRDLKKHDVSQHNDNEDGIQIQPILPYLSAILNVKAENVLVSLRTDTVYVCVYCNFSTTDIDAFIKHSLKNKKQCKTYVCGECSNVYKKKSTMKQHAMKPCYGSVKRKIQCPECNLEFSKNSFVQHKRHCKVIKCYTCGTHYKTIYELSEHQSKEHPLSIELKACSFCWKQCVGSVALQKHIDRAHKGEFHLYKYMCIYCKTSYKHPQKLFGHFFTKHKELEPYTCKICSRKFRLRKQFTIHIKMQHSSKGFVEFDKNYHVFFTEKKSDNPFIPKSIYVDDEKTNEITNNADDMSMLNSEMSVTETEGNQTEIEKAPKASLKRKRVPKPRKKEDETITLESSDDDNSLLVVRKRVPKIMPKVIGNVTRRQKLTTLNKKRFTCDICDKYCYTYQNYNHHVSLHSKKDYKKCIKCSKVFRSKEKLNDHIANDHSSSKLTDTLKTMLEKRKKGESYTDSLPMSEKFRRTIKKVAIYKADSTAKIKLVENDLSVQKFIENFTPEIESKPEVKAVENSITVKLVTGLKKEPTIKMTKYDTKPIPSGFKLAMPVKFKAGNIEKTPASIRLVQQVSYYEDSPTYDHNSNDDDMDRNDSIPEVAEEVMLEGTEETPRQTNIPHKIVIPKLPTEYKDLRIAHLLPEAPFYKIVKVNDVLNLNDNEKDSNKNQNKVGTIKLPDGKKLVNTNPLAHLLGKTSLDKVFEPMKNKYYKAKPRNFKGMLAEALSNLDKPAPKKKKKVEPALSDISSLVED
uniref:C2H2-type domain-containing protein n=1 Tax=Heliothis virescens TaxID=7102 RepID=A0A2A4JHE8_HELVI